MFSVEHDAAASLLHMRAQGVSALVQLKPTGLPVILHWGADLGDLDGLSARSTAGRFRPDRPRSVALDDVLAGIPRLRSPGVPGRPLAGSHDGHTSAASFTDCQSRLISETAVLPGLTEVGADTVIIEAHDRGQRAEP